MNVYIVYKKKYNIHISISRFALPDKVTLQLLKIYLYIGDVVKWSRVLDMRHGAVVYQRFEFKFSLGKTVCQHKNQISTLWLFSDFSCQLLLSTTNYKYTYHGLPPLKL